MPIVGRNWWALDLVGDLGTGDASAVAAFEVRQGADGPTFTALRDLLDHYEPKLAAATERWHRARARALPVLLEALRASLRSKPRPRGWREGRRWRGARRRARRR